MVVVVVTMVLILAVAALVTAYVAFPHRGERLPALPWLGQAMARAADAAPVIEERDDEEFRLRRGSDADLHR